MRARSAVKQAGEEAGPLLHRQDRAMRAIAQRGVLIWARHGPLVGLARSVLQAGHRLGPLFRCRVIEAQRRANGTVDAALSFSGITPTKMLNAAGACVGPPVSRRLGAPQEPFSACRARRVRGGRCGSPGIHPFAANYRAFARPGKSAERMLGISGVHASAGLCNRMRRERRMTAPSRPNPAIIRAQVCGSGIGARKPLISPPGNSEVWILK